MMKSLSEFTTEMSLHYTWGLTGELMEWPLKLKNKSPFNILGYYLLLSSKYNSS